MPAAPKNAAMIGMTAFWFDADLEIPINPVTTQNSLPNAETRLLIGSAWQDSR